MLVAMAGAGRLVVACGLLAVVVRARADTPTSGDVPWARGVTPEQKAAAQHLLDEGNELLLHNQYREALGKYEQAVAVWDHPAIRFNIVRAQIALGRSVDAADNLDKALAYGQAPLDEGVYREALNYQRLLAAQLATVEITCTQHDVHVTFDGAPLLTCPGTKSLRTTPGVHAIVGTKSGFLTRTFDSVLLPGKRQPIAVSLVERGAVTVTHRWAVWKPWVVAGGGAALAGAGAVLEVLARNNVDRYDQYVQSCQSSQTNYANGCPKNDPQLVRYQSRSRIEQGFGIPSIAVGGAALVTGVVLIVLNRPHAFVAEQPPVIMPVVTKGGAGAVVSGRF